MGSGAGPLGAVVGPWREIAAGRMPSVLAIRARLYVWQPWARRVRVYLTALSRA